MKNDHPPEPDMIEKEKYLRLAADFDNYRRRMESDVADVAKFAGSKVVQDVVDVMDYLDAAVRHAPDEVKGSGEWFKGLEQVDAKFLETMKKFGVTRIATVGEAFDPSTMEAVSMISGGKSQTVSEEVRTGYMMHERVIRPARVIINE